VKIAVASGKGGTGKTTFAVNLAAAAAGEGRPVTLLDCDAEDPDCYVFLKAEDFDVEEFGVDVPAFDAERCDYCGRCGDICRFNAIIALKENVLTFPELCHACGGCWEVCPHDALHAVGRAIGEIRAGNVRGVNFIEGRLAVGERSAGPVIREVRRRAPACGLTLVDAPPGTACAMVEATRGSDYVLLVTEPTPFGLYDLGLAVDVVRELGLPVGVVVNRAGEGEDELRAYCDKEDLEIVAELPDDRGIAEVYAGGNLIVDELPAYRPVFDGLLARLDGGAGEVR
jgi:MinD superfamily P-loop ATPase